MWAILGFALRQQGDSPRRLRRCATLVGVLICTALLLAPVSAAASGPRSLEQPYLETAGRAEVGETLSCYPGTWEGSGVTYTYEWQRDGAALTSGPTHQITAADEGHWLSCVVSATDSEGTTTASSVDSFFINPPRQGPPQGGTIEGHVTDAASGQPIDGVKACAVNTDDAEPWVCVHTDVSGRYKMTVAEAGHFVVEFAVPPHSTYIAHTFYGGKYSKSEASVLTIGSGSTTTGIDVQLYEGGRITGTVTDALTGLPVEAVEVCAREAQAECVWTNAHGEYTVAQLASGSYSVEFGFGYGGSLGETYAAPEYYKDLLFQASEPTRVSVSAGATAMGIDAEMHHWGELTGRVTSAFTHAPIEGVEVDAYDGGQHTAVTNANGEYTIPRLGNRSGEYTVSFSPLSGDGLDFFPQWYDDKESQLGSDPVHVPLDHTTSGIDAALSEGGQIAGTVTDAHTGQRLAGIFACARNRVVYEARCTTTGTDGGYKIPGLPTGAYTVEFYSNSAEYFMQYYNDRSSEVEADPVSVEVDHTTSEIDAALEPVVGGVILGTVREAVWAKPLANIEVCAYTLEQEELFGSCTSTNAEGEYSLRGLTAGRYLVEFSSPGPGLEYASQFYDQKASVLYAETVTVTDGKFTSGIGGELEKAGDASGRVTNAETGKPLQGIEVCYYARTEELVGCLLTNAAGEYSTPPVARGEYKVLFASPFESGLNYAAQFYGGAASINDSPYVTIEAGKLTTGIHAQMTAGGRITGTVTNAGDGKVLEEALVCALPGFGEVGGCALTHAGGQYAIEGLAAGRYDVLFEAKGHRWQYYEDVSVPSEARSIVVSAGATSGGVDAAMQPTSGEPPRNLQQPTVSGNATVGEVLECSSGSWAGSPAPSFTYNWLRNGHANVGSGNAYRVQQADKGSSLRCEVTAENSAGSASAFSNPVNVPAPNEHGGTPPPPPPPPPVSVLRPALPLASMGTPPTTGSPATPVPGVGTADQTAPAASISTSSAVYTYSGRRGGTFVDSGELVHCPAGMLPCQIVLEVEAKSKTSKLLLAYVRLNVPADEVERLRFKLDAAGTALLRGLKRVHATVVVRVRRSGTKPVTVSHTIVLRSPASHGRRP
jgi:Carboxypeptidase regulatory-like domain